MGKKLVSEDHNDQRSENSPSLEDHSGDELAKGLHTGTIFLLGARRLVLMTFSVALAVVILGATAFAQGNAAQDQYGPQTTPPTAPPNDTQSKRVASPNTQYWQSRRPDI
jgi:hypothetical protein